MAKSGQVQLYDGVAPGDEALADSVVFTESTPTSLGGIASDLLDKSSDPLKVVVDPLNRRVYAFPVDTDLSAVIAGAGIKLIGTITRDDATKRSSPVTMADGDVLTGNAQLIELKGLINGMFAAAKPSKNASSLINALEDAIAGLTDGWANTGAFAVLDQTGDGSVKIYAAADPITDLSAATAKIKQVPAASGSTVTPLAFE